MARIKQAQITLVASPTSELSANRKNLKEKK